MKKTYYEKVGRRYVPVREYDPDFSDSFTEGAHLIVCKPNYAFRRYNIDPDLAPLIAAGLYARDALEQALMQASELRPSRTPLTPEQQAAWRALAAAMGQEMYTLQSSSISEVALAGIDALVAEAEKLMTNPAVRDAYEQFLMVCKLSKP